MCKICARHQVKWLMMAFQFNSFNQFDGARHHIIQSGYLLGHFRGIITNQQGILACLFQVSPAYLYYIVPAHLVYLT